METFINVSVILPLINETVSLRKTVDIILETCPVSDLKEFLVVVCPKTTAESLAVCEEIRSYCPVPLTVVQQTLPFLGGALRTGFALARGTHVVIMASDLETTPSLMPEFVRLSKKHPNAIITATRWGGRTRFKGYNPIKLVSNFLFQKFFSFLYQVKLTDMTFGYRLFPLDLVRRIHWEETRHPFNLETVVKPLRLGTEVIEVPTDWSARIEGESQNTFFRNFEYFRIGFKTRFNSVQSWIQEPPPH